MIETPKLSGHGTDSDFNLAGWFSHTIKTWQFQSLVSSVSSNYCNASITRLLVDNCFFYFNDNNNNNDNINKHRYSAIAVGIPTYFMCNVIYLLKPWLKLPKSLQS